jgi:fructokinase
MILGAIEAGGTKFLCGLFETGEAGEKPTLLSRTSIHTTTPARTIEASLEWFVSAERSAERLGIGSFGPVDLDPESPRWGFITSTPKPFWRDSPLATVFRDRLGIPVAFDTDVNAAALGEATWGSAVGLEDIVYVTVGTGIGGGVFSGGRLVHGRNHPELGHIKTGRLPGDDYPGHCPFHKDCLEGMAAGPAIGERWGTRAENLPPEHPAWELEASYLSRAFAAYTFAFSPRAIIMGGGVGMRPGLAERVEALLRVELGGYVGDLLAGEGYEGYLRRPGLGHEAGLYGSAALALSLSEGQGKLRGIS